MNSEILLEFAEEIDQIFPITKNHPTNWITPIVILSKNKVFVINVRCPSHNLLSSNFIFLIGCRWLDILIIQFCSENYKQDIRYCILFRSQVILYQRIIMTYRNFLSLGLLS